MQGRAHRIHIQGEMKPAHPAVVQRRTHRMTVEYVAIRARYGRVTRVKAVGHGHGPLHRDGSRQQRVDTAHPGRFRTDRRGVEMRHLRQGMHAGIRAPGCGQAHRLTGDGRKRALQVILDGIAGWLRLPAAEAAAVVFDADCDSHGSWFNPQRRVDVHREVLALKPPGLGPSWAEGPNAP